jgi:hypothetical protein
MNANLKIKILDMRSWVYFVALFAQKFLHLNFTIKNSFNAIIISIMKLKLRTKWDNFCISYYILNYNSIMKITRSGQNCKLKKKKPELFLLDLARQKTSSNFKQTLQNLV